MKRINSNISADDVYKIIEFLRNDDDLRVKFKSAFYKKTYAKVDGTYTNKEVRCCTYCGGTPLYAKGLCRSCYNRARNHGGNPAYAHTEQSKNPVIVPEVSWQTRLARSVLDNPDIDFDGLDESVECAVKLLDERRQLVIQLRYKENMTLKKCGENMGVSRERVRQLERKAIRMLRHPSRIHFFYPSNIAEEKTDEHNEFAIEKPQKSVCKNNMTLGDLLRTSTISVRAHNCFCKSMWNLFGPDFMNTKASEFLNYLAENDLSLSSFMIRMRNCGEKTAKELVGMFDQVVEHKNPAQISCTDLGG